VGTADQLAERLAGYGRAGLDELLLLPDLAHRDEDTAIFARDVLPALRDR
jgi:alkanesulfonate monooxygenase SsuD/methylene tetrahydromethanopterin reductase-like flavin-dependent oxidoreductase (luciferase family)